MIDDLEDARKKIQMRLETARLQYKRMPPASPSRGHAGGVVAGLEEAHFDIIGKHPEELRAYYATLFGWSFDTPSPVAAEVSDPDNYGFLDLVGATDGPGIRGGVGGGPGFTSHAVFYVAVPDVEAALTEAERLGGHRVMGPVTSPNGLVVGHFTDPEGTLIGLAAVPA
jgi:predicted enzyme related to lactoylglutathione lyase